jgi:hypothetical protein
MTRLADLYPRAYRYLQSHRQRLVTRLSGSEAPWYAFRSSAALQLPPGPKLMMKRISLRPDYTLDPDGTLLCNGTVILLASTSKLVNPLILLGVLNSSTFWAFVRSTMPTMGDGHALRISRLREFCFPIMPGHNMDGDLCHLQNLVAERLREPLKSKKSSESAELINQAVARLYTLVPGQ